MADQNGWTLVEPAAKGWTPVEPKAAATNPDVGTTVGEKAAGAWDWANTPLAPWISKAAKAIADRMDPPQRGDMTPYEASLRGFKAGAVEGIGHVVEGFTSPIGIALSLAGLGPESGVVKAIPGAKALAELPAVQSLQRAARLAGGAGFAAHGAGQMVTDPTLAGKAQGLTEAAAGLAGVASEARAAVPSGAIMENPNPAEADAVRFARDKGIPVDAGTATGSRMVKGVQAIVDSSPVGAMVERGVQKRTQAAMEATGKGLAADVHPEAVSPEQAGLAVRAGVQGTIDNLAKEGSRAYQKFEALAGKNTQQVEHPYAAAGGVAPEVRARMGEGLGDVPSPKVINEVRRIGAELDAVPFKPGQLMEDNLGNDSSTTYSHRSPGAPVFHDILAESEGGSATRGQVQDAINRALETGQVTPLAKAAFSIAEKRLNGGKTAAGTDLSGPILPPDAGRVGSVDMASPVDVTSAKAALTPIYDAIRKELPFGQQQYSVGLKALQNIVEGPDTVSAVELDKTLGSLKALVRQGPEQAALRGKQQAVAAFSVGKLEAALRDAVSPEAMDALRESRGYVRGKYQVGEDVLKRLNEEGVGAYRSMAMSGDARVGLLRKIQEAAPAEMPKVGRAIVDNLLDFATKDGGFQHGAKIASEWGKIGPETKKILFGTPERVKDLDRFFLLARKLSEKVNPSGTATTWAAGQGLAEIMNPATGIPIMASQGALSAMLHSEKAVSFLLDGMTAATKANQTAATRAYVAGQVLRAARAAGVSVPQAAEADRTPSTLAEQGR